MTHYSLVADIGGTNARFALVKEHSLELEHIHTLQCADYDNIDGACLDYLQRVEQHLERPIEQGCFALACPVYGQHIKLTNNHWQFTREEVCTRVGLKQIKLINDFTAQSLAMLHINESELIEIPSQQASAAQAIQEYAPGRDRAKLVIGPGTGLGVGGLIPANGSWVPLSSEGGHTGFAPKDDTDLIIFKALKAQYGRVSNERILSGQGILDVYRILCEHEQQTASASSPADVLNSALDNRDAVAVQTMDRFCLTLGRVVGNDVLILGAQGGVYLCGGILPRMVDFLLNSGFREALENKGRFSEYMQQIPVWLNVCEQPGLLGSAAALNNPHV